MGSWKCDWCGKYFELGTGVDVYFCSMKCARESKKSNIEKHGSSAKPTVCEWCGNECRGQYIFPIGDHIYCSQKCNLEAKAAGVTSGYVEFPDDAVAEYEKANNFYNNGSYNDALNSYTKAINMGNHHPDTYGNRGNAYYMLGKYQSAITDYNNAIGILNDGNKYYKAFNSDNWIENRLEAYMQIGDYTHALKDANFFVDKYGSYSKYYYLRGLVYWYMGDKKKAKEDFKKALEMTSDIYAPEDYAKYKDAVKGKVPPPPQSAQQAQQTQQAQEAQEEGFQGVAAQGNEDYGEFDYYEMPDKALKEFHKATKFFNDNEYAKAVEAYTKTIQLNGIDPDVYGRRGQSYMLQWDNKSAIADLTKALELYNSNVNYSVEMGADELHYLRGKAYMDMDDLKSVNEKDANDLKHAIEDFSEIIKIHNKDEDDCFDDTDKAEPYFYRGSIYLKMGDKKKAVADLKRAVLLAPNKEMYTTALKDAEGK